MKLLDGRILRFSKIVRQYIEAGIVFLFYKKKTLEELKKQVAGKPILIVGNGPSLNQTPLDKFDSVFSIGMNKIDLIFPRTIWRPNLITVINGQVIRQHKPAYQNSNIPVFMDAKGVFLGAIGRNIHYFCVRYSNRFSTDYLSGLGSGATVTYSALQLAYMLGASMVVLVGVDHAFNQTGHTYVKSKGDDENHFDPNYFGKGAVWGLPDLEASERVYQFAKEAFEKDGRKIYDATVEGKLQVFEKISINQALQILGVNSEK